MDNDLIEEICNGDLKKLKSIPKSNLSVDLSKKLLCIMEEKIKDIEKFINILDYNEEIVSFYLYEKKNNIENCILYLKKIS